MTPLALFMIPFLLMVAGLIVFLTAADTKPRVVEAAKILFAVALFFVMWFLADKGLQPWR